MKTNRLLLFGLILSLLAAAYLGYRWRQTDLQLTTHVAWTHSFMDSVATTMEFPNPPYLGGARDSVYWQWVAMGATIRARQFQGVARRWAGQRRTLLDEADMMALKEDGLDDPARRLRDSLIARADLIPFPGELGGTMRFGEESIVLLDPPYAFATFDDGHVGGHLLAAYSVNPGGRIEWTQLWAKLE
jgi:hypothetical protein